MVREIKRKGGQAEKIDGLGYIFDFAEVSKVEDQLVRDLGVSPPQRDIGYLGEDVPPDGVVVIECRRCKRVYTLRGHSQRLQLFVCPDCGEHMENPVGVQ